MPRKEETQPITDAGLSPITVEVVRHGLIHVADQMAIVLRKTPDNMMIYEVRDCKMGYVIRRVGVEPDSCAAGEDLLPAQRPD